MEKSEGTLERKRLIVLYIVMLLWVIFGFTGALLTISFTNLAIYFISLTGFVGSYIYAESVRGSSSSSIFKKGRNSSREIMMYIVIFLWSTMATLGFIYNLNFVSLAEYYAALTPFVGAYMIGKTFKPKDPMYNDDELT